MGWVLSQQAWIQKKRQNSLGKEDSNRVFFEKLSSEQEITLLDCQKKSKAVERAQGVRCL